MFFHRKHAFTSQSPLIFQLAGAEMFPYMVSTHEQPSAEPEREAEPSAPLLAHKWAWSSLWHRAGVCRCTPELAHWAGRGPLFPKWKKRRKQVEVCWIKSFQCKREQGTGSRGYGVLKCTEMHTSKIKAGFNNLLHCMLKTAESVYSHWIWPVHTSWRSGPVDEA